MAINKAGVHFLHSKTHETLISYPFSEVISTRRFKSETNVNYLDMKCGDLMVQKITRIETDQGTDISALTGQYINIFSRMQQRGK
jgi:myosin-15